MIQLTALFISDVYPDCNAIKLAKAAKNPLGNHHYGIDPDGADPIEAFVAQCDFKSDRSMGITKVWLLHNYRETSKTSKLMSRL